MTGFVATLALALVASPGQADGVSLKWTLKAGDTFYAKTTTNLEQTIVAMGNNIDQKQDQTTVHRYKVLAADKDGYKLEQTILQAVTESNLPGVDFADLGKKMKGAVFTITMNDKFKVTKMEGVADLAKKLGDDNPILKQVLAGIMNEEVLKRTVEDVFGSGPDKPVKVGDTWKQDETFPLGPIGEMAVKMSYKLEKSKDGVEEIAFTGDAKYSPPKEAAEGLPFTISKADLKTDKFAGTTLFDSKAGRTKETKAEMNMSGSMTVKVGEAEIGMDLKQKLTTKTEVTDKNPVVD
jgi:hypothetical protein